MHKGHNYFCKQRRVNEISRKNIKNYILKCTNRIQVRSRKNGHNKRKKRIKRELVKLFGLAAFSVVEIVESSDQNHGLDSEKDDQSGGGGAGHLGTGVEGGGRGTATSQPSSQRAKLPSDHIHIFAHFVQQLLQQVQLLSILVLTAHRCRLLWHCNIRSVVLHKYLDFTRILQNFALHTQDGLHFLARHGRCTTLNCKRVFL